MNEFYIITGSSNGLGRALAKSALTRPNCHVAGIARHAPDFENTRYKHFIFDLENIAGIGALLIDIWRWQNPRKCNAIHLINNAGTIAPIGLAAINNAVDVGRCIAVNLTAPVVLANLFLASIGEAARDMGDPSLRINVVNVSSGVADRPMAYWSAYSAAKAGLKACTFALAKEHARGIEGKFANVGIYSFFPGIVDTAMQAAVRATSAELFPDVERFHEFHRTGALRAPGDVAEALLNFLDRRESVVEIDIKNLL